MSNVDALSPLRGRELTAQRVYTVDTLEALAKRQGETAWLVEDLLMASSFNVLVGDSTLGKTPLALQLAACVVTGEPWLGWPVRKPGRVLYLNGEMSPHPLVALWERLVAHIGFPGCRDGLYVHNPEWGHAATTAAWGPDDLRDLVRQVAPTLVIVDPLRVFFPEAEVDQKAFERLRLWARSLDCCVLVLHHRRKQDQVNGVASLESDPLTWLQETAGLSHIINLTDARLGIEPPQRANMGDLVLAGTLRSLGAMVPRYLFRSLGTDELPVGYSVRQGLDCVSDQAKALYADLKSVFRYKDARALLNTSSESKVSNLLKQLQQAGLIHKQGDGYRKT